MNYKANKPYKTIYTRQGHLDAIEYYMHPMHLYTPWYAQVPQIVAFDQSL